MPALLSKHGAAHQHPTKPRHLESSFFAITMHGYVHTIKPLGPQSQKPSIVPTYIHIYILTVLLYTEKAAAQV